MFQATSKFTRGQTCLAAPVPPGIWPWSASSVPSPGRTSKATASPAVLSMLEDLGSARLQGSSPFGEKMTFRMVFFSTVQCLMINIKVNTVASEPTRYECLVWSLQYTIEVTMTLLCALDPHLNRYKIQFNIEPTFDQCWIIDDSKLNQRWQPDINVYWKFCSNWDKLTVS